MAEPARYGFTREPAAWTTGILAIIEGAIGILVVFEIVNWTPEQTASVLGFGAAAATAFAGVFIRRQTTPTKAPKVKANGETKDAVLVEKDRLARLPDDQRAMIM